MKIKIALIVFLFGMTVPQFALAQTEPEDIGLVSDDFQNSFYESLAQKGIENYDKAITALEKCQKLQPNNSVVYFEMGKNYLKLKNFDKAYSSYEKATQLDPKNMWYFEGMYDVCYQSKDYVKAIEIVNKLVTFKDQYKDDLVSLYMTTQQFDKALELINELNDKVGKSDIRESYKAQILRDPRFQGSERSNLVDQIKKNPKEESNYLALIRLYNDGGQEDKAMEIASQLEREIPSSDWAQVSLFKLHLDDKDGDKAVKAMDLVLSSSKIDNKIKHRMLNEFLIFAKDKPQYDADVEKAVSHFNTDKSIDIAKEIGKFYHQKSDWPRAIRFYEMELKNNPDDTEAAILQLQAYSQSSQFDVLAKKAEAMTESFPLEPQFYYYAGIGYNNTGNFKKAKDLLEAGADYIVENKPMQAQMYKELQKAYTGLGDKKKADEYAAKASKIK